MNIKEKFTLETASMKSSMIRELVASTKGIPNLISLAGGFPNPATFDKEQLAQVFNETLIEDGNDVLQYGASNGDEILKNEIKKMEKIPQYNSEEILITSGSTNGIYLFSKAFVEKGDAIICEAPSFLGSLVTFEAASCQLLSIEMDNEGMRADLLKEKIEIAKKDGIVIKFIYLIPEFQNPTGITMTEKRRIEIIKIAAENDIPILEDNPYGPLRYNGSEIPDLYKIARKMGFTNLVTCVKSFSKILGPGLRLAYIIGDESIITYLGRWQQKITISADCVTQRAVAKYIQKGFLEKQLSDLRSFYRPLRDAMLQALQDFMPEGIKWTTPDGGMFVWIELPENISGDELFEKAKLEKVAFIPGSKFYPSSEQKQNVIRLNFSYPTKEEIIEGVKRIGDILKRI